MEAIHSVAGALAAGLVTSLHCAGMCGPLACGLGGVRASEGERLGAAAAYHVTRLFSYSVIGGVCGALGEQPLKWVFNSPAVVLPWILAAAFVVFALGLEKKFPRPAGLARYTARFRFAAARMTPVKGGAALGALTPLLPCGPLYLLFGVSLASGSFWRGAEFALAFGLGTVPLLWVAQTQMRRLGLRLTPAAMGRVRRSLALVAAVVLVWRLQGTLPMRAATVEGAGETTKEELPSCCH